MNSMIMRITAIAAVLTLGCSPPSPEVPEAPAVTLPAGILHHAGSKARGGRRSQVRAVIAKKTHTQAEIESFARLLSERYDFDHALVTFFDDAQCFRFWDGKGALVDSDWPHCLCRVLVDRNGTVFQLAMDESTSQDRTDVVVAVE